MDGLDQLIEMLRQWAQTQDLLRLSVIAGVWLLVFVSVLGIALRIRAWTDPLKRRVDLQIAEYEATLGIATSGRNARALRLLERLGQGLVPLDAGKRGRILTKLTQAGFRSTRATALFYAAKVIGLVLLPIVVGLGLLFVEQMPTATLLMLVMLALAVGGLLPDSWLAKRVRKRQAVLRRSLPDALDMLVICVEAGLGLNAAIQRVAEEMAVQHPELAREFSLTIIQMRAGLETRAALEDMVQRTGSEEIKSLVSTLIQAMRFGTGIANTLRVYAEEMRDKRLKAAEEQAAKASTKMLIPIGLFMLPAFLIIAVGPPLINLARNFSGI